MPTHHTPNSMTADPYLLRTPGLLHRVDTAQLGQRDGVAVGACCIHDDCNRGRTCPQRLQQPARQGLLRAARQWLAAVAVFVVVSVAQVVMGKPQDH